MKIIKSCDLSDTGIILRPRYMNAAGPSHIPETETAYSPTRHHRTHTPRSLGLLCNQTAFSAAFPCLVQIDIQIKSAQSDVYYIPRELAHLAEFYQMTIDHEHNRTPTAFTRGVYLQVRQGLNSPAGYWHYDIGNPSSTYLVVDKDPTIYAPGFPLRLLPSLKRSFAAATLSQDQGRELLLHATDFSILKRCRQNDIPTLRFRPYEVARHDHLTVHRGVSSRGRTLATTGYIDSDQPALYNFLDMNNNMFPQIAETRSAPVEEAAERLARYLKRFPPQILKAA